MRAVSKLFFAAILASSFVTPARAVTYQLVSTLGGAQAGTLSTATGSGMLTYDDLSNLLTWNIEFSGLTGTQTAAHFHGPAAPGANAGVQIGLGMGSPIIGTATLSTAQGADLLNGLWYVNIHSDLSPAGEIRGQLLPVPEPETYAMLAVGLGLVGFVAHRRRRL